MRAWEKSWRRRGRVKRGSKERQEVRRENKTRWTRKKQRERERKLDYPGKYKQRTLSVRVSWMNNGYGESSLTVRPAPMRVSRMCTYISGLSTICQRNFRRVPVSRSRTRTTDTCGKYVFFDRKRPVTITMSNDHCIFPFLGWSRNNINNDEFLSRINKWQ